MEATTETAAPDSTATPATPATLAVAAPTAVAADAPALTAREQAIASLDDDATTSGDTAEIEPVAPAPAPVAKPPLEVLTPTMQAAAREEKRQREQREAFQAERTAFAEERAAFEADRGKPVAGVEETNRLFATDIVALADRLKLTPEQRQALATDLHWSGQPEDKRPPSYRKDNRVRTELDVLRERTETLERALATKDESEKQARDAAEVDARKTTAVGHISSAVGDAAPIVRAFLKAHPEQARNDLWVIANQLNDKLEPGQVLESETVVAAYEEYLDRQSAWLRGVLAAAAPKDAAVTAPKGTTAPNTLSNRVTASPTRAPGGKSVEDRRAAALASLDD